MAFMSLELPIAKAGLGASNTDVLIGSVVPQQISQSFLVMLSNRPDKVNHYNVRTSSHQTILTDVTDRLQQKQDVDVFSATAADLHAGDGLLIYPPILKNYSYDTILVNVTQTVNVGDINFVIKRYNKENKIWEEQNIISDETAGFTQSGMRAIRFTETIINSDVKVNLDSEEENCTRIELTTFKSGLIKLPKINGIFLTLNTRSALDIKQDIISGTDTSLRNVYLSKDDFITFSSDYPMYGFNIDVIELSVPQVDWIFEYYRNADQSWQPLHITDDTTQNLTQTGLNKRVRWNFPHRWSKVSFGPEYRRGYVFRVRSKTNIQVCNLGKYRIILYNVDPVAAHGLIMNAAELTHLQYIVRGKQSGTKDVQMSIINSNTRQVCSFIIPRSASYASSQLGRNSVSFSENPKFKEGDELLLVWNSGDVITDVTLVIHYKNA